MICLAPITLYRKTGTGLGKDYRSDIVACGRCPSCLKRRQFHWVFRLEQEQKVSSSSAFLTLTYDDDHLPYSKAGYPTLNVRDHQLFMKRLRKTINENFKEESANPIKYYMVGEYGTNNHRPHYHSIIFNLPLPYFDHPALLDRDWQNGHSMLAVCNTKTIRYVTKYMHKTLYTEGQHPDDDRKKEFSCMSRGLGSNYLTPRRIDYYRKKKDPYLTVENGDKISIPRYYKEKIFDEAARKEINKKAQIFQESNPLWNDEKQRHDLVSTIYLKQKKDLLTQNRHL